MGETTPLTDPVPGSPRRQPPFRGHVQHVPAGGAGPGAAVTGIEMSATEDAAAGITAALKDELSGLPLARRCCRRVEAAVMLQLTAALLRVDGQVVLTVEVDHGPTAQRLSTALAEAYGHHAVVTPLPARPGGCHPHRWAVQVGDGQALAERVGLMDDHGHRTRVLFQRLVAGPVCDAAAAWRGAVLAGGLLSDPGQLPALQVCHCGAQIPLARALLGAARRLGAYAVPRTVRGTEQVLICDPSDVADLLTRVGAPTTAHTWKDMTSARRSGAIGRHGAP